MWLTRTKYIFAIFPTISIKGFTEMLEFNYNTLHTGVLLILWILSTPAWHMKAYADMKD